MASIILGVLTVAWPGRTLTVLATLFGIQLIVWGISLVISRAASGEGASQIVLGIIAGLGMTVFGLVTLRAPGRTLALVALLLGSAWFIAGVLEVVEAVAERIRGNRSWRIVGGLLSAIAGIVVVVSPIESLLGLAVLAGLLMIVVGIARIPIALRLRASARS